MFGRPKKETKEYWLRRTKILEDIQPGDIIVVETYVNEQPRARYQMTYQREQRGILCFIAPRLTHRQKWAEERKIIEIIKAQSDD